MLQAHPKTLALLLGCLSVAALPPYYCLPILIVSFGGLMLLTQNKLSYKNSFSLGYWFGFGYFALGLFWINHALMLDLPRLGWLIPITVISSGGFFGLFCAFPLAMAAYFHDYRARLLAFAVFWTFFEWIRSFIFTGFPWNLLGTVWAISNYTTQAASIFGTYGLSMLAIIAAGSFGLLFVSRTPKNIIFALATPLLITTFLFGFGFYRLNKYPDKDFSNTLIRIVQPSIPQQMKWKKAKLEQNLQTYVAMSQTDLSPDTDLVIWGETANPFVLTMEPKYFDIIQPAVPDKGFLLTGAVDYAYDGEKWRPMNVMQTIKNGRIVASYGKSHLVPFGEYIPFRKFLPQSLKPVTNVIADFMPGEGLTTIKLPEIPPFGILICYEIIFPAEVADTQNRPQWLITLTNDGWYGDSAGPRQHLVATQMRAVEEGLTVVRAANSGISALISKTGIVLAQLPLNTPGTLDIRLPKELSTLTFYAQYHNLCPMFLGIFLLFISLCFSKCYKIKLF